MKTPVKQGKEQLMKFNIEKYVMPGCDKPI